MAESLLHLLTEERTLRASLEKQMVDLENELTTFKAESLNGLLYSRLSLSRIPRDSPKYFEISIPRHIRFAELRKKSFEQPHLTDIYVTGLLKLGVEQEIIFDQVHLNVGNNYDVRHGNFRAPVDGTYEFTVSMLAPGGKWAGVEIVKNDVAMAKTRSGDSSYYTMGLNVVTLHLKAGDDVWVRHISESDSYYLSGQGFPTFSGYLLES